MVRLFLQLLINVSDITIRLGKKKVLIIIVFF